MLIGDLNDHRDVLVDSVSLLSLDTNVPAAVSARHAAALESHIGEIRAAAAAIARAAAEGAREAARQADAARARLTAIGERLDAEDDAGDLDAVVDSARATADDARFAERRAREEAERFAALVEDVERLRTLLAAVREKERALGDLEDALKPGAFLKWLTLRRSRRLLVHASRMLEEMTGRRYSFVDPGETEEQWRVLDRDSNQPRTPASLSGGEQFIASLSLALGMVEMMARSGGRLESLFLDEGFGSLDRNNLDAAVQALGAVAAGGRMVGVISHVRAVAEQIDHVLAVTRSATGSKVAVAHQSGTPTAFGVGHRPGSGVGLGRVAGIELRGTQGQGVGGAIRRDRIHQPPRVRSTGSRRLRRAGAPCADGLGILTNGVRIPRNDRNTQPRYVPDEVGDTETRVSRGPSKRQASIAKQRRGEDVSDTARPAGAVRELRSPRGRSGTR